MTYAPAVGVDPDFDTTFAAVWAANVKAGNPEGLSEEEARERLAEAMTKHGGRTFTGVPAAPAFADEPEPEPVEVEAELVIPQRTEEPYWWDDPQQAKLLEHFILSRRALGASFEGGLVITGPSGSGKTMSVRHAVRRLNETHQLSLRLLVMNCAVLTDPQRWFGRREVIDGDTKYIRSDFIESIERGDVILLDEIGRMHPHIANGIHSLLDGSQSLLLSDLNVTITVNPETVVLATMNEGVMYGGQHRLDWAFRERFPYTLPRPWPPRDEEIHIVTSRSGCDPDGAANLVDIAAKTRAMFEAGDLRAQISTRELIAAGWLVASGKNERDALAVTAIPMFDGDANGMVGAESDRQRVAAIIEGRFPRRQKGDAAREAYLVGASGPMIGRRIR